ncbi:MAG: AbrB/MazE/SpoVT family DNA-binding domain-containing protein [Nitrospirae bacterium]|nr:AbrB/MazE/SpoVT family DNA-binding domain-containing protein [Nitrospirota bacterium]
MKRTRSKTEGACCAPGTDITGCCKVEAVVPIDERGQMVLPKEVRDKAGIKAGDKLAVISCGTGSPIGCLCVVRADAMGGILKSFLGPLLKDLV